MNATHSPKHAGSRAASIHIHSINTGKPFTVNGLIYELLKTMIIERKLSYLKPEQMLCREKPTQEVSSSQENVWIWKPLIKLMFEIVWFDLYVKSEQMMIVTMEVRLLK